MTQGEGTAAAVPLDQPVAIIGDEFLGWQHPADDVWGDIVAVSWEIVDAGRARGVYTTHAGAWQTVREFPHAYERPSVRPVVWRNDWRLPTRGAWFALVDLDVCIGPVVS